MKAQHILDRAGFVDGFTNYATWSEGYQPAVEPELFRQAAAAVAAGHLQEAAFVLNGGGSLREAMTAADLPILLAATVRTRLMRAYDMVAQPWRQVVSIDSLPDLEQWTAAQTLFESDDQRGNTAPNNLIPEVPEHQGYDEARLSEASEYAQLKTYGIVWSVSRRMMLADNLRAINNMSRDVGIAMRRTENWLFVDMLENGASTTVSGMTLKDGVRLFATAASRANMVSGTHALAAPTLSAQLIAFGAQKDRNGISNDRNGIRAKYLLVPPALEETAWNLVSPAARIAAGQTDFVSTSDNYFKFLTPVTIPELTSSVDWYLAADPNLCPGLVAGFLGGRQEPEYFTQLENANLAEADGTKQKLRHDVGFWAEQWHGLRKIDVTG